MTNPDHHLRSLVEELNEAEAQTLDEEGPIQSRFHDAVAALCAYVGIPNKWAGIVEEDRRAHPERYASIDRSRDIPPR